MKTVVVTGACGFIGSHFLRLLMEKTDWRVVNLDDLTYAGNLDNVQDVAAQPRYSFVKGDISDRALVDKLFQDESPSALVNFAAESHVDRSILDSAPFITTNVTGVQVLLEAARRYGIEKFLHISTDEVYGDVEGQGSSDEASLLAPSSPYSASKASADLLCLAYQRTYDLPVTIARSCNNYGPFQFPEKLIPLMTRNALMGQLLPVYGDGLQQREWMFVTDNVNALFSILNHGNPGEVYNVGGGEGLTNLDVVRSICQIVSEKTGQDVESLLALMKSVPDRPGHDRRYALESKKIRGQLGWAPTVDFQTGLRTTVSWYLDNADWVERVTSGEYQNYYKDIYANAWRRSG